MTLLSESRAGAFARLALANVGREYPRKVDHLMLAATWPERDARRAACEAAAQTHFAAALPQVVGGDYVGEHWLASFAALAMGESP